MTDSAGDIRLLCALAINPIRNLPDRLQTSFQGPVNQLVGNHLHYVALLSLRSCLHRLDQRHLETPRLG